MMENRSGQISVEFMLLIALVLLIFIPLFILVSRAGFDTSEQIGGERIGDSVQAILDEARETYYLGEGSRQRITIEFSEQLNSMAVVNTSTAWEIVINFTQGKTTSLISAVSEVPLTIDQSQSIPCDPLPVCTSCTCTALDLGDLGIGAQDIELRTKLLDDKLVVEIGYR